MRHHLRHQNFKDGIVEATREFFESKPWTGTSYERAEKMNVWARKIASLYGIIPPVVMIAQEPEFSVLAGSTPPNVIVLPSPSVIYLFHYFRHYMQAAADIPEVLRDPMSIELDAVDWSCSLFYQANPAQFEKSVRTGKIRYVTPDELTPPDDEDLAPLTGDELAAFDDITDMFMEELDSDDDDEFLAIMEQWSGTGDDSA